MTDHCDVQTFFFGFERSFCRCMAVMSCALGWCVCDLTCFQVMWLVVRWFVVLLRYYSVLQSTTPVLLCTTKYYSVLQSTTPVLLCTTQYFSSTTLYYKVLRQYYSVLQSTTPVLLQYFSILQSTTLVLQSTTQYYASTTLYYPVLQRTTLYYKVLQRTTPVLLCTTKDYASITLYYKVVLLCTTKYYNVLLRYYFETSLTMRGASKVTLQPHQIRRLPRKMNVINDLRDMWTFISNARRKWSHPATSSNTAPATQNASQQWSASHMERHFQCAESGKVSLQTHQILRLPRKMNVVDDLRHIWNVISNARSQSSHPPTSPNTAPATKSWSSRFQRKHPEVLPPIERRFEHNPRIKSSSRTRRFGDLTRSDRGDDLVL